MARYRDESDVPNTCPFIDMAISELKSCGCDNVDVAAAVAALEKVRGYNEDLRTWGNDQYRESQDALKQIDSLQDLLDAANETIEDQKKDIKTLEDEVTSLEGDG